MRLAPPPPVVTPHLRRLTLEHLEALLALQATVMGGLPTNFLRPKSAEELEGYLSGARGAAYGVLEGRAPVAMALLRIPDEAHPNLPPRIQHVPAEDWALRTCFLETTLVLPAARGRGYQRALLSARRAHARSVGLDWLCAGVRLENVVSWANLLACGWVIADMRLDPGFPVLGMLGAPLPLTPAADASAGVEVPAQDADAHLAALRSGYVGARLAADGRVHYQRWEGAVDALLRL